MFLNGSAVLTRLNFIPLIMNEENANPTRLTWAHFRRVVSLFLKSDESGKAKLLAIALFLFTLCIIGMNVVNSYVGRDFMSAIEHRNFKGFYHYALLYLGVFVGSTIVAVICRWAEESLGLLWRNFMTRKMVALYIDQRIYLHMEELGSLTNPDQRIAEDVKQLTVSTLSFLLLILNGTITALSFSGVLWSISPHLFVVAVAYAGLGSLMTILLGRPLIRLNYQQSDQEADFRSELIRVREHAEGIALIGNEGRMRDRLLRRLDKLVNNYRNIIGVNRRLNYASICYNYLIQLIPVVFIAPMFIRGEVEFGVIGQAAMAFATLLGAFSLVVTQFQSISTYASVLTRLTELLEASDRAKIKDAASCIGCSTVSDLFAYNELTLHALHQPDKILIDKLTALIPPKLRVLVTGPNDAAKQGFFRASAGLYDAGTGNIYRPPLDKMAFLPEQPYLPSSTLRELLVPKELDEKITDTEITEVVRAVGLGATLAKHNGLQADAVLNWQELLSFSEQQLAAVGRVMLARPDFAFLDHLDSALPEPLHKHVLKVLADREIACISVGDEKADPACHDVTLEFFEDGTWKWTPLHEEDPGLQPKNLPPILLKAPQVAVAADEHAVLA